MNYLLFYFIEALKCPRSIGVKSHTRYFFLSVTTFTNSSDIDGKKAQMGKRKLFP